MVWLSVERPFVLYPFLAYELAPDVLAARDCTTVAGPLPVARRLGMDAMASRCVRFQLVVSYMLYYIITGHLRGVYTYLQRDKCE